MHNQTVAQRQPVPAINWKVAAELPALTGQSKALGLAGPVVGVHHQVLVVAGGANFPDKMPWLGGAKKYYEDIYVFEKEAKGNTIKPNPKLFRLPNPVAYGASCSTSSGIICAGGENDKGITNQVLLIQWDTATKKIAVRNLPDLPIAVTNAAITAINNKVYVGGGEMADGVSNHFYSLNLNHTAAGWKQLPSLPKPISHAIMVMQSSSDHKYIYMIGGRKKNSNGISDLNDSVYRYDLKSSQWQPKQSLPYALSAGTGMATGTGEILLFGGDKGETFHKTEQLLAAIAAEKDHAKKQQLNQQKATLQAAHPGFSKEVLQYNALTDTWKKLGTIPFEVPVTTTAVNWADGVLIPSGEIKAGVRTPQLLLGKFIHK
ncbi:MAG: Kelch repeat-containing protein [Adhaeribacter sp.]